MVVIAEKMVKILLSSKINLFQFATETITHDHRTIFYDSLVKLQASFESHKAGMQFLLMFYDCLSALKTIAGLTCEILQIFLIKHRMARTVVVLTSYSCLLLL